MSGSTIKKIELITKLILIVLLFAIVPPKITDVKFSAYYYFLLFLTSFITYIWCQHVIDIDKQNNKVCKKTINKIKKINLLEDKDYPIFYEQNQEKHYLFIKEKLNTINKNQIKLFKEKGYVIIIGTCEKLNIFYKFKTASGLFSKADKYIILFTDFYSENDILPFPIEIFEKTFHHEWGHFVDFSNKFVSSRLKFLLHFMSEKDMVNFSIRFLYNKSPGLYLRNNPFKSLHEYSNSSEYFANNYSKYKRNCLDDAFLQEVFEKIESKK